MNIRQGLFMLAMIIIAIVVTTSFIINQNLERKDELEPVDFWLGYNGRFYHFFNYTGETLEVNNHSFNEMRGVKEINFGSGLGTWNVYEVDWIDDYDFFGSYNIDRIVGRHQIIYLEK